MEALGSSESGFVIAFLSVGVNNNPDGSIDVVDVDCDTLRADPADVSGVLVTYDSTADKMSQQCGKCWAI